MQTDDLESMSLIRLSHLPGNNHSIRKHLAILLHLLNQTVRQSIKLGVGNGAAPCEGSFTPVSHTILMEPHVITQERDQAIVTLERSTTHLLTSPQSSSVDLYAFPPEHSSQFHLHSGLPV